MIEKQIALNILEDIQDSLMKENWKEESLKNNLMVLRFWEMVN